MNKYMHTAASGWIIIKIESHSIYLTINRVANNSQYNYLTIYTVVYQSHYINLSKYTVVKESKYNYLSIDIVLM